MNRLLYFCLFDVNNVLINETISENKRAVQNPDTEKSGTIIAANKISNALITRENNPSVTIVIGKVKIKIIGLINILIIPSTIARIKAPSTVTVTPGNKYAATKIASVDIIQCVMFMYIVYLKNTQNQRFWAFLLSRIISFEIGCKLMIALDKCCTLR